MTYTVWYKKRFFWKKIENVEGDTILENHNNQPLPARVLYLVDKTRLEIPMSYLIRFSKERFFDIEKQKLNKGVSGK